ncbi:MAG: porin family protein [Balneolales bacterium]
MKSRTRILTILLPVLFMVNVAVSQQQTLGDQLINYGLKGGINQSTLIGYNNEDINTEPGYQFGLFLSRSILDDWLPSIQNLHFRVELNYIKSGAVLDDTNLNRVIFDGADLFVDEELHGIDFERQTSTPFMADEIFNENIYSTFKFHFVESPFLFIYSLPMNVITPYILAGPSFSVLFDMDYSFSLTTDGSTYTQTEIDENVKQHIGKLNIGAKAGLGIKLFQGLFVEAFISQGFTNALEFYSESIHHRGIVANIGFEF